MPRSLIWLTLGAFAIGTEGFMIAGLLPVIASDLKVSVALTGQLVTVFALAYAVGSPVLAVATGNVGRKKVLIAAIGAFSAANLLAAAAPSYQTLMAARILLALCAGAFMPTASGYAAMVAAPAQRGRSLALIFAGITIALVVGVPLGTIIGDLFTWRATFLAVALLSGAATLGVAVALTPVKAPPVAGLRARLKVAARGDILSVLTLTVLAIMGAFVIYPYVAPLLEQIAGFSGNEIAILLLLYGVGGAAGNYLGGYASDKWNIRRFLLVMLVLLAADYALLSLVGDVKPTARVAETMVIAAMLIWGIVGWAFPAAQQVRLVTLAGPLAPIALSLNQSALYLGIALGAGLGSLVIARSHIGVLGWVGAACELVGVVWLAAAPVAAAQRPPVTAPQSSGPVPAPSGPAPALGDALRAQR
jgi:predicted MFS family arabinose efflux permease